MPPTLQRAHMNCTCCYDLAQPYVDASKLMGRKSIICNGDMRQARDAAMEAVESCGYWWNMAEEAVNACKNCDFKTPNIANLVEKSLEVTEKKQE